MMQDAIRNFAKQFEYQPVIENADNFRPGKKFVICGMGGSALSALLLKTLRPELPVRVHRDYGLPAMSESSDDELVILSSYSGNTEEVLEAYKEAREKNLSTIAISVGGRLLQEAKEAGLPYIVMPDTGIQPRMALGFSLLATLTAVGEGDVMLEAQTLARILKPTEWEQTGKELAQKLKGRVPVIYASSRNKSIAYNWKIKFNETGKIPAFYNVVPELNHNEMTGFDVASTTKALSEKFHLIILKDDADHPKIRKRMEVLEQLYAKRGLVVDAIELKGKTELEKIFTYLILADWTACFTAEGYGVEAEQVPMVEEFKKLIS